MLPSILPAYAALHDAADAVVTSYAKYQLDHGPASELIKAMNTLARVLVSCHHCGGPAIDPKTRRHCRCWLKKVAV